jgi:hypothetical protein
LQSEVVSRLPQLLERPEQWAAVSRIQSLDQALLPDYAAYRWDNNKEQKINVAAHPRHYFSRCGNLASFRRSEHPATGTHLWE